MSAKRRAGILIYRASEAPSWLARVYLEDASEELERGGLIAEAAIIDAALANVSPSWALDKLQHELLFSDFPGFARHHVVDGLTVPACEETKP